GRGHVRQRRAGPNRERAGQSRRCDTLADRHVSSRRRASDARSPRLTSAEQGGPAIGAASVIPDARSAIRKPTPRSSSASGFGLRPPRNDLTRRWPWRRARSTWLAMSDAPKRDDVDVIHKISLHDGKLKLIDLKYNAPTFAGGVMEGASREVVLREDCAAAL